MAARKIRTLIVDDSVFFREFLSRSFQNDPQIEIVGVAADAFEAERKVAELKPDVITLDMEMPKMRGPDFLRKILPKYPGSRVVVISAIPNNVFEALHAGAVDFISKPNTRPGFNNDAFIKEAASKIRIASNSVSLPGRAAASSATTTAAAQATTVRQTDLRRLARPPITSFMHSNPKTVIAIGASTGGTEAIVAVIKDLPANTPGIVIVQHMPPVFTKMYAERLDRICKMRVHEAQDGDRVQTGHVFVAAGDRQMKLQSDARGYYVRCGGTDKVSGHCPSVDVLFESTARTAGANALGVILTGMGADGAKGLLEMKKTGAFTIGQDQASCVVYGMPMVAFNIGAVQEQLPLDMIGDSVLRRLNGK